MKSFHIQINISPSISVSADWITHSKKETEVEKEGKLSDNNFKLTTNIYFCLIELFKIILPENKIKKKKEKEKSTKQFTKV